MWPNIRPKLIKVYFPVCHRLSAVLHLSIGFGSAAADNVGPHAVHVPLPGVAAHRDHRQTGTSRVLPQHSESPSRTSRYVLLAANCHSPSAHSLIFGPTLAKNRNYIDKNFGAYLIIFDRLFGTYAEEDEEVVYGITTRVRGHNIIHQQFYYYTLINRKINKSNKMRHKLLAIFAGLSPNTLSIALECDAINYLLTLIRSRMATRRASARLQARDS